MGEIRWTYSVAGLWLPAMKERAIFEEKLPVRPHFFSFVGLRYTWENFKVRRSEKK